MDVVHVLLVRDLACSVRALSRCAQNGPEVLLTPKTSRISVLLMTDRAIRWVQRQELGTSYVIGKKCSRKSATDSARHSSMEEDTSPSTEPVVCPGLYQEVLSFAVQASQIAQWSGTYTGLPVRGLITFEHVTACGCELGSVTLPSPDRSFSCHRLLP